MKSRSFIHHGIAAIALLAAASVTAQQRPGGAPRQAQQQAPQQAQALQPAPPPVPALPLPNLPPPDPLPTVALSDVLERVTRDSNKQFLVDLRTPQQIFLGGARIEDVNYPLLLSILRANGLAAATIEGRVNIVRDDTIRAYPLPIVNTDDPKIPADEWVQRIITTSSVDTAQLVPVLRPMLPQSAHMAASPPRSLIVVDRYANVKRITETVKALDRAQ
jgi:hypothetical protein